MTGYGSRQWLIEFISSPRHERFYPDTNDRMPSYAQHADQAERNILTAEQIGMLADWLRGDWYEPKAEGASEGTAEPTGDEL